MSLCEPVGRPPTARFGTRPTPADRSSRSGGTFCLRARRASVDRQTRRAPMNTNRRTPPRLLVSLLFAAGLATLAESKPHSVRRRARPRRPPPRIAGSSVRGWSMPRRPGAARGWKPSARSTSTSTALPRSCPGRTCWASRSNPAIVTGGRTACSYALDRSPARPPGREPDADGFRQHDCRDHRDIRASRYSNFTRFDAAK